MRCYAPAAAVQCPIVDCRNEIDWLSGKWCLCECLRRPWSMAIVQHIIIDSNLPPQSVESNANSLDKNVIKSNQMNAKRKKHLPRKIAISSARNRNDLFLRQLNDLLCSVGARRDNANERRRNTRCGSAHQ